MLKVEANADVAELADAQDLESCPDKGWEFNSPRPHK